MLTLAAGNTIQGVTTGAATAITYTIFGDALTTSDSFQVLAQGQLPTTAAALYTVPAATNALVKSMVFVNTTGAGVAMTIYVNGTVAANSIGSMTIPANGLAMWTPAEGWCSRDANGSVVQTFVTPITFTGDVTGSGSSPIALTIAAGAVTNAKMANQPANSLMGEFTGTASAPQDLALAANTFPARASTGDIAATAITNSALTFVGSGGGFLGAESGLYPKELNGTAMITIGNPQGWAGSDVGAWINAAWAYLVATYPNQGGKILIGPGAYNFTTPIVVGSQYYALTVEGSGCSSGANDVTKTAGTALNYTATSGTAFTFGGGDNNTGNVVLRGFSLNGTALGNGATAFQYTNATTGSSSFGTMQNVAVNAFTNGIVWQNSSLSYGLTLLNCQIQFCTTGMAPQGENNVMIGGLIGSCGTGIACTTAGVGIEMQCTNVSFDDMTTTAINMSNALARVNLIGCRFENPSLTTTSNYLTISAGSVNITGGSFQDDNTTGTATGFIQSTGGTVYLDGTWLWSGGRTFTQAFNVSSAAAVFKADPVIGTSSAGITQLFNIASAVFPKAAAWSPQTNVVAVTATSASTFFSADSRGGLPLPANARAGTTVRVTAFFTNTATASVFNAKLTLGTANTSSDGTVLAITATSGTTATAGGATLEFVFVLTSATTAQALYQLQATAGFGGAAAAAFTGAATAGAVTVATTSATFLGLYFEGASASVDTCRSVTWEVVSN